jgi:hypothetical protein
MNCQVLGFDTYTILSDPDKFLDFVSNDKNSPDKRLLNTMLLLMGIGWRKVNDHCNKIVEEVLSRHNIGIDERGIGEYLSLDAVTGWAVDTEINHKFQEFLFVNALVNLELSSIDTNTIEAERDAYIRTCRSQLGLNNATSAPKPPFIAGEGANSVVVYNGCVRIVR